MNNDTIITQSDYGKNLFHWCCGNSNCPYFTRDDL